MNRIRGIVQNEKLPHIAHWINGGARQPLRGESAPVFDPATGKPVHAVGFADAGILQEAVSSAVRAFPAWAATPAPRRADILFRYRELLRGRRDQLADIITQENGKTLAESRAELDRGMQVVEFAAGIPHLMKGEFLNDIASGLDGYSVCEPVGVCLGITPFNFPAMVPMWMFPVAIAAGNTFILKPSEKAPTCATRLAALFEEAGLPPGVFNIVHGARETVEKLISAPEVAAVSFVGSTPVARAVYRAASDAGKRAQCLGGAKNHLIVMADADMDAACAALTGAAYGCAGERCMAISVAVAVGKAGDQLVSKLATRARALKLGSGSDPATDVGPLVTEEHRLRVTQYLDTGVGEGARLVVDGRRHTAGAAHGGFFLGPSLFDHVTPDMKIYRDEIFGPVLCVVRAADLDEAIAIANGHEYANGAAIFTADGAHARRFVRDIEAGMIGVNVPVPAPTAYFGFGGHKQSLFGPLHVHGTDGVRFYTRVKSVTSRWPEHSEKREGPSGF
ncbi:MAG TPA: CoA-acylating methylmalonate-semialdehyde dehydrogenase [Gammaproteobacteria bacterium]|nr:CoA-acylating methylmalonate-semialdehyde dehydrogenase [Gammaproteobacteria bacterium]